MTARDTDRVGFRQPPVALDLRLYAYQVLFRDGME